MAADAAAIHTVGSKVWVKDDAEAWVKAEAVKVEGPDLVVSLEESGVLRKVKVDEAPLQNQDARGVEVRLCLSRLGHAASSSAPHRLPPYAAGRTIRHELRCMPRAAADHAHCAAGPPTSSMQQLSYRRARSPAKAATAGSWRGTLYAAAWGRPLHVWGCLLPPFPPLLTPSQPPCPPVTSTRI